MPLIGFKPLTTKAYNAHTLTTNLLIHLLHNTWITVIMNNYMHVDNLSTCS